MNPDLAYAQLCQRVGASDCVPDWQGAGRNHDVHAIRGEIGGRLVVCWRGSKELRDWLLDLIALPVLDVHTSIRHLMLGPVHAGFMVGAESVFPQIRAAVTGVPYALCGHSLGGALALVTAGLLVAEGFPPPAEIVTFGAPRPAMLPLRFLLRDVPIRAYHFGADPVPAVPTHPFCHPREPLLQVGQVIRSADLFANHHIVNYIGALSAPVIVTPQVTAA